jgi:membrane-bound lytic murein transglycosylase B
MKSRSLISRKKLLVSTVLGSLVLGLAGCDTIPVIDPNKIPRTLPWQQTSSPAPQVTPPVTPVPGTPRAKGPYLAYPEVRSFIGEMSRKHNFSTAYLESTLGSVQRSEEVLGKVRAPAEAKPWRSYRPIFLTEDRIRGGIDFWNKNRDALDAAARKYGVDPAYIVAIIGVETAYGRNVGKYNVLQSLTTLAFDYPARKDFYRKELEQFLLLSREERLQPHSLKGSYAGAMGMSQFISSSYRNYAVDFNNDRHRDLWRSADAIGSVANYLAKHGWKRGGDVAVPATVSGNRYYNMADTTAKKPRFTLSQLRRAGVTPRERFWSNRVSLIRLDGMRSTEYWVAGDNFYTITRYNHSPKYAMAVHQLAQSIRNRR